MPTTDPFTIDCYYRALVARDPRFAGVFYVGVKTTGVFCLATCRARKPKKENVVFYSSAAEAARHGYRPCKVCRPLESPGEPPACVALLLRELARDPAGRISDHALRLRGVGPSKVRRWFLQHHGVTFHAYQRALRLGVALKKLQSGEAVTAAAYEVGYDSLSGFGSAFKAHFGSSPVRNQTRNLT